MKNIIYIIFITLGFSSCSFLKQHKQSPLNGLWTEHWGKNITNGNESDVSYVDTLEMNFNQTNNVKIKCVNQLNYIYKNSNLNNQHLNFTMENNAFFVYYTLTKINDKLFKGTITNSNENTIEVELRKITP